MSKDLDIQVNPTDTRMRSDEAAPSAARRQFFAVGAGAAGALMLNAAMPAHADIVSALGKILYLEPIVVNFALEMEELECDFFNKAIISPAYAHFDEYEQNAFNLIAQEDEQHVCSLKELRDKLGDKSGNSFSETRNMSHTFETPAFTYPGGTFHSRGDLLNTAVRIKESAVFAYHGAVPLVGHHVLAAAAAIAGVEGRHAAVLRLMNGMDPVPSPFETAVSAQKIGFDLGEYGFMGGAKR